MRTVADLWLGATRSAVSRRLRGDPAGARAVREGMARGKGAVPASTVRVVVWGLVLVLALALGGCGRPKHGPAFVPGAGPVERIDFPPDWSIRYAKVAPWAAGAFILNASNGGRIVRLLCSSRRSGVGRLSASASAAPTGYQEVAAPGGIWLVKWEPRGRCWALARNRPVLLCTNSGWSRAAALGVLRSVTFRPRWHVLPTPRGPRPRGGRGTKRARK